MEALGIIASAANSAEELPEAPEGFAYVLNADDEYLVNADGAYLLTQEPI